MPPTSRQPSHRPAKLYFYADGPTLERALQSGEFRLLPAGALTTVSNDQPILPFGPRNVITPGGFLTLSLASAPSENRAPRSTTARTCLVINDTEAFGERLHRAVGKALPQWAGIDAAVAYGAPSPLGVAFTKAKHLAAQKEWLFAWRPIERSASLNPVVVQIGSIAAIAVLCDDARNGPT